MSDWEHDPTTGEGEDASPLAPRPAPPRPWWAADADPTVPPDFTAPVPPVEPAQPAPSTPESWPAQPPAWPPQAPPSWPPSPPPPGPPGGGLGPVPGTPAEGWPAPPSRSSAAKRVAAAVAAIALVLASAGIGAFVAVAVGHDARPLTVTAPTLPVSPFTPGTSGNGSGGSTSPGTFDANVIASKVIPAIVNITTTTTQGRAAGTGMVVSASGEVLTNNHVIADSTDIKVDIGGTGNTHSAHVVGYNVADDVALLQIEGVSNLPTVKFGDPSKVNIGDRVVAIGNALGRGGTPAVVQGKVTALDQEVTAGDPVGGTTETLHNVIQIDAPIQPGDSGGALVNTRGEVIGMNTAAAGGRFRQQSGNNVGFAIRADNAVTIVRQIQSGVGSDKVHIGGKRALLGVRVSDIDNPGLTLPSNVAPVDSGALVIGVEGTSAAGGAGIKTGDVVVSVDGTTISNQNGLHLALTKYQPGDEVRVGWVDTLGATRAATVKLGEGPPA
jgi:S1-C subfamily serine protease